MTKAVQSALSIRPGDVFLSKSVNPFQFLWCWFVYFIMTFNLAIEVEQEFSDAKKECKIWVNTVFRFTIKEDE